MSAKNFEERTFKSILFVVLTDKRKLTNTVQLQKSRRKNFFTRVIFQEKFEVKLAHKRGFR